jgi:5'(3')-deoxyribonucleotidase
LWSNEIITNNNRLNRKNENSVRYSHIHSWSLHNILYPDQQTYGYLKRYLFRRLLMNYFSTIILEFISGIYMKALGCGARILLIITYLLKCESKLELWCYHTLHSVPLINALNLLFCCFVNNINNLFLIVYSRQY